MDTSTTQRSEDALSANAAKREEGAALLRQGRYAEAAAALAAAADADPSDETSWRLLGGAFASQGDYGRAAEAFQRVIVLAPDNARNQYNLGLALEALERSDEARAAFEAALATDPNYTAARVRLDAMGAGRPFEEPGFGNEAVGSESFPLDSMPELRAAPEPSLPEPPSRYAEDRPVGTLSSVGFAPEPSISANPSSFGGYVPQPVFGAGSDVNANDSGMRAGAPPEVATGWNWGAFYLSILWLLNHQLAGWGIGLFLVACVPWLGGIVHLGASIYLGIKGNELGWSNRRFQSVQDFKACQTIWAKWSLGVFLVGIVLSVLTGILYAILIAASLSHVKASSFG